MTRHVLITRSPADCRDLQELVRPAGLRLRPFPVIRVENHDDAAGWRSLDEALATDPERPRHLLLASPRAPQRFVDQCRAGNREALLHLGAAAVGGGTAEAAEAAGLRVIVVGPGTGLGLAEQLRETWTEPSLVAFPCGVHRRDEMPRALAAAGHRVLPVEVYRMRRTPPRELPSAGPADLVVLTSPRAARFYLEAMGGLPLPIPHWALGPTTRDAAAALGIECRIPPEPDIHSLAEELCRT
jgi:uroporphyrinogen-III synthase